MTRARRIMGGHRARFGASIVATIAMSYLSLGTSCGIGPSEFGEPVRLQVHFEPGQASVRLHVSSVGAIVTLDLDADLSPVALQPVSTGSAGASSAGASSVASSSPDGGVEGPTSGRYRILLDCDDPTAGEPLGAGVPVLEAGSRCVFDLVRPDATEPRDAEIVAHSEVRGSCNGAPTHSYAVKIEEGEGP